MRVRLSACIHTRMQQGRIRTTNQSVNVLFDVCSHRGDIRQKQKHIIIIYTNFPTGL